MRIGIHYSRGSFCDYWIDYCKRNGIAYKLINLYRYNVIEDLEDCDYVMWHFSQNDPRANVFAKQLIFSLEAGGKTVFPNYNTVWHFDDKLGQKYLLEAIGAPVVNTWVFYDKEEAFSWANSVEFPKVFKLRSGAGSQNVKLILNRRSAIIHINRAFGKGFSAYDPKGSLVERWRKFRIGNTTITDVIEGCVRFVVPPPYSSIRGKEKGYIYFQDFIPGNNHDIRVIVIGNRAFAIKRMIRSNDFRASGSGFILYDRHLIEEDTVRLAFELAVRLKGQSVAFDFIYKDGKPLLLEISYGFVPEVYTNCPGYWDRSMNWHQGIFNPYGWMVEDLIKVGE